MEMWGLIQIAVLVLIVVLLYFMWRADSRLARLEQTMQDDAKKKDQS